MQRCINTYIKKLTRHPRLHVRVPGGVCGRRCLPVRRAHGLGGTVRAGGCFHAEPEGLLASHGGGGGPRVPRGVGDSQLNLRTSARSSGSKLLGPVVVGHYWLFVIVVGYHDWLFFLSFFLYLFIDLFVDLLIYFFIYVFIYVSLLLTNY